MKTMNKLSGSILRAISVFLITLLPALSLEAQTWYNSNWLYRSPITVSNSGTTELTDFQVNIILSAANFDFSKANSDGSDIRFTSSDGTTLIPFWIESWISNTSASIWVKAQSIPVVGTTLFLYYGNSSSSTSTSSGTSTFTFFDDFESWSVTPRPAIWQDLASIPTPSADNTISVYDNKLYSFGGYGIEHLTLSTTYEYNPSSNLWTYKALMPTGRWGMVSVEFNGNIYVFGGDVDRYGTGSNANEIYNPATDIWTSRALGNPLPLLSFGASGVYDPDVIYFPGGRDGYEYWMINSPYNEQQLSDNPSILRSHDGVRWTDSGITNPIISDGASGTWNALENADPDFLYVSDLDKWFMVWIGADTYPGNRRIALAYSSDGKNWTQYNGPAVNGNTNPVILSGTDDYGESWERNGFGSQTSTPTLFYQNGIFYLFYGEEVSDVNQGKIGLATFTWNNETNSIVSLIRDAGNPIIDLPADANFKAGGGHIDVSKNQGSNTYRIYIVRELLNSDNFELGLVTSSSLTSGWTNQGKAIERGSTGQWDETHIYASCPVVYSSGEIVLSGSTIRMYYSAFNSLNIPGIGIADLSDGSVVKFSGTGPIAMPADIAHQGLMGVRYGDKIHLFYKSFHYEYDPVTDTYERKSDVPHSRTWGTCAVVDDNIYIIGGYSYDPGESGGSNNTQVLDLNNDSWTEGASCPHARYGSTRENPVIDGKIYVTHGWNDYWFYTANYVYDPVANTWEQKGSANHPRDGVACGVIGDKLYVVGGRNTPTNTFGLTYNEVYDPALDTWVPTAPPSTWSTSGANFIFADESAKYQGNNGLIIRDPMDGSPGIMYYAQTTAGFGTTYALDFDWNVTTLGGVSSTWEYPQATLSLSEDWLSPGMLYFLEKTGGPTVRWFDRVNEDWRWTDLTNSTWDRWHKVTVIRNGENSQVVFDGDINSPLNMITSGAGQFKFGAVMSTQYLDNVRVRKWAGYEPITMVGIEQNGTNNHWVGTINSDWNNAGNWSNSSVPLSTEDVTIFNAPHYPVISDLVNTSCNNLTIEPSASLTVQSGGSLTVSGVLTINSVGAINSGSLIVNGTLISSPGAVEYNRFMPFGFNWHYISSPVSLNLEPSGSFYGWNEVAGDWTSNTIALPISGVGYTLNTSGNLISFHGTLVTSNVSINATSPYRYNDVIDGSESNYDGRAFVQSADNSHSGPILRSLTNYGGGGWNLLGNPYTSAINVTSFIERNYSATPTLSQFDPNYVALYLYDGNDYYYVSNSTGWPAGDQLNQENIQAGQGFFVLAMNDASTFTFTSSMQTHSNLDPLLKSAKAVTRWPGLQIKAKSDTYDGSTTIVFGEEMSSGLDPGYDVGYLASGDGPHIYTTLVKDNGVNFAQQALPIDGSINSVVAIGVDYLKGGKLTISAEIEPLRNYKFWLEDRLTGVFTNMETSPYTVNIPANTFGTGRFFLHVGSGRNYRKETNQVVLHDIRIWSSHQRQINIQGTLNDKTIIQVFDIIGHKVYESQLPGGDFRSIVLSSVDNGVYLIKLTDGAKIVIGRVLLL